MNTESLAAYRGIHEQLPEMRRRVLNATMSQQRTLFDDPHARFEMFHAANPQVYAKLVELSRAAKSAGRERLGIRILWERLRWFFTVEARTDDDFKLNNNHTPFYARLIMQREPDLAGFFETREQKH